MNTSYRSVWNHALGAWVAVSEVTRSRGKRSGSTVAIVAAALIGGLGATGALAQATSYGATGTYPNPINASGGVTLTVAPTAVADQTGLISDFTTAGGIVKDGTGTLQLSNTGNSYVGVTSIAAGILRISSDLALGNAANGLQLNGGTLQFGAGGVTSARAITVSAGGGSIDVNDAFANVLSGGFAGSGALALVNLGTSPSETTRLTLSGSSAGFTGTTQVGRNDVPNVPASGRINVAITSNGALGTGNNAVNIYNNGELDFTGTGVTAGNLQIQTLRSTNTLGTNSGVTFAAGASAGNATISSNAAGALIDFQTGTTAATSTLNNSGGGRIYFEGNSTGGTATINNTDGRLYVQGTADLSGATVNNAVGGSVYISDSTTGVAVGRLSGAGNVVLGGKTLTVGAASILGNSDTISGVISDLGKQFKDLNGNGYNNAATATGGSVVKVGAGTLALTGANTYSGGTGITAGTLAFNNAQALGTGAVVMTGGELLATNDVAFGDALQSITFNGSATVAAATGKAFTFTAGITNKASVATFGNATDNGVVLFTPASVTTTNVASLNVAGGTLRAGDATGLNALTSINASTTVAKGATLDLNSFNTSVANLQGAGTVLTGTDASKALTVNAGNFAGSIQGADSLIKNTVGTLVLSGTNTYTGATTVNAGVLRAGAANVLPVGTALTVANAATLDLNNQAQTIGSLAGVAGSAVTLGSAALTTGGNNSSTAFNGVISGTGSLVKTGTGTFTLGGANSYTGATNVNAGTLQAGAANVLPSNTAVTVGNGATLALANLAQTIGSLAGAGAVTLGSGALTTGGNNTNTAFTGAILGSGSLVKTGTGVFAVSGANTYTGTTTVAQGTLSATAANALSAASAHTVASGATLALNGNSQIVASLTNAGIVSLVGTTPGTTLTVNGAYVGNGGTLALGTLLGASGTSDRLVLNGPGASASGSTNVAISNFGGLGALTTGNGIEVVTAQGGATSTKTAFALAGGHVDAGAFQYRLYAADASGNGSSFFLRTQDGSTPVTPVTPVTPTFPTLSVPSYRAEVPVYSAMGNVLRQDDLAMLGNLHRRMGDDANVAPAPATGVTGDTGWGSGNRRAWGRVFGGTTTIAQGGTVGTDTRASTTGFQTGVDLFANDRWNAGVYIGALRTDANVSGNFGLGGLSGYAGSFRADSQYLAGYATYQIPQGMYADFVLQYGRQDVTADALFKPSAKTKGDSLLASAEVGQRFAIGDGWAIEPQAQLVYHRLNLNNTGITGFTNVQQNPDSQVLGRIGVRLTGDMMTSMGRFQPYARVNLWHGFGGTDSATFVGLAGATTISSRIGYTSTELAVGATLSVTKSVSLYGEVGKLFHAGGSDARVKTSVQGSLGVKFAF